mgnify:CR=1 FL=1
MVVEYDLIIQGEIAVAMQNLGCGAFSLVVFVAYHCTRDWMKPKSLPTPLTLQPASSSVRSSVSAREHACNMCA